MKIEPNKKIQIINRITPKREDRKNFFTMDRNERVDDFSSTIIKKALSQISSYDLRTYPDNSEIYNNSAYRGGGLSFFYNSETFIDSSSIYNNIADYNGM